MIVFNIKYDDKTVYHTLIITQKPIVVNIVSNTMRAIIECDRYKCIIYHASISYFHENKSIREKITWLSLSLSLSLKNGVKVSDIFSKLCDTIIFHLAF